MQVRGLLIAIVALGLLAAGMYWSDRQKSAEEAKDASSAAKLVHVPNEAVRKLEIQRRDAPPVVLERGQRESVADACARNVARGSGCCG